MRILIIDGHAFAYRAFFAIRDLSSPSGQPTNAIYGFINMLEKFEAQVLPSHTVVVWDGGLDEGRVEELSDYKDQRDPMPDDMEVQLDEIEAYLAASGIASVCHEGVEADDRIGQLTKTAESEGFEVAIVQSISLENFGTSSFLIHDPRIVELQIQYFFSTKQIDMPELELVNDRVRIWNPSDKSGEPMDENAVKMKTGVRPNQIVDWLSLVGDAADNIPGVRGIGVKTAAALLNEFGSVNSIYERLEDVKREKQRQALADSESDVRRNQELVSLKLDLEDEPELESLRKGFEDTVQLEKLYEKWGFKAKLANLREARQSVLFDE